MKFNECFPREASKIYILPHPTLSEGEGGMNHLKPN